MTVHLLVAVLSLVAAQQAKPRHRPKHRVPKQSTAPAPTPTANAVTDSPAVQVTPPATNLSKAASPTMEVAPATTTAWSMVVLSLGDRGVGTQLADLVSETVLQEAHKLDGPRVTGMKEVQEALQLEAQKDMLGCSESQCMAEIAGALGVDRILSGIVGKVGESWVLTLKVIGARTGEVERQASERISGGRGEEFLDLVGPMMEKLFPDTPLAAGQTRGAAPTLRARAPARLGAADRRFAWATGGVSAVALGSGAVFGFLAKRSQDEHARLNEQSLSEPVAYSSIQQVADTARTRARIANVLYIAGGVCALTSAVLFAFVGGESTASPAVESASPVVSLVPFGVAVAGGF